MEGFIGTKDFVNMEAMKYWSFTNATPMEKRQSTVKEAIFSGDYIGALKVDGYYERIIKDDDGNCFMIARSRNVKGEAVNKIEWVPQLQEWFKNIPNGTCFLCECFLLGKEGSKNVTSILGCLKEKAIARQEKTPLRFYIFDVMACDGVNYMNTPFEERVAHLKKFSDFWTTDYVRFATYYEGKELWENLQNYLASDREGMVIMRKDAKVYEKRTPARVSIKVKKELQETIDCVILGANPPTRLYCGGEVKTWKYWENVMTGEKFNESKFDEYEDGAPVEPVTKAYFNNWAGSLIIGARKGDKLIPIGSLSGLTEEILANWQDLKGRVIEITAMEIMKDTKGIRHPKFVGFRDDLLPRDTDWNRIFGEG